MKFIAPLVLFAPAALLVLAVPVKRNVDPTLVPEFGLSAGINPTGTGDCDGITNAAGQVIKIPCNCPPDRTTFIQSLNANVNAGKAVNNPSVVVSFPTDNSKEAQIARIQAALVTLQNLNGPGIGCPAASTTLVAQQKAVEAGTSLPAVQAPSVPTSTSPASGVDPALVPDLGHPSGLNPTGTGDCDGITNAAGQIVKIPCSCPPDRETFIKALNANVAAGKAVNNPSVALSFPNGDSNEDMAARIVASLITLQNINGPGIGCPAASTTLSAQLKALQG